MTASSSGGWAEIERRALYDPHLHQMMAMIHQGMRREEALIATVLALSKVKSELMDQAVQSRRLRPAEPHHVEP